MHLFPLCERIVIKRRKKHKFSCGVFMSIIIVIVDIGRLDIFSGKMLNCMFDNVKFGKIIAKTIAMR